MKRRTEPLDMSPVELRDSAQPGGLEYNRRVIAESSLPGGKLPRGISVEWEEAHGVRMAHLIKTGSHREKALFHIHGGGWTMGVPCTGQRAFIELMDEVNVDIYSVDYRLAPENPYPAALKDCISAYKLLLEKGYSPDNIVAIGESAGGNLCLAVTLYLKDNGLPLPGGLALISPVAEVRSPPQGEAAMYVGGADCAHPYISPVNGDFHGFPPVLLQFGGSGFLKRDGAELAFKLMRAGVDTLAHAWEFMPHVFVLMQDEVPEAEPARREIEGFVRRILEI